MSEVSCIQIMVRRHCYRRK